MRGRRDREIKELGLRHQRLTEELCALVVCRIAERCRRIAPGATTLVYRSEYESDTQSHFPSPVVVIDDIGDEVEVDDASTEADALRGDLEMLFDLAPGTYLGETHLVFEGERNGAPAGRLAVSRQEAEEHLSEVRARFEATGGRGVDDAEEIDRLKTALGLAVGDRGVADEAREALFGSEGALARPDEVCEAAYRAVYAIGPQDLRGPRKCWEATR